MLLTLLTRAQDSEPSSSQYLLWGAQARFRMGPHGSAVLCCDVLSRGVQEDDEADELADPAVDPLEHLASFNQ